MMTFTQATDIMPDEPFFNHESDFIYWQGSVLHKITGRQRLSKETLHLIFLRVLTL